MKEAAEYKDTAVLLVRHLTKTKRDKAIYNGMGSMDVIGAARSAFLVARHPDDENLRIVAHVKHNISERGQSWLYKLVQKDDDSLPILEWVGPSELTIDDLMIGGDGDRKSALDQAIDFLLDELKRRPLLASEIEEKAEAHGIAKRTIDRARKEIGVVSRKSRKGWTLSLPNDP